MLGRSVLDWDESLYFLIAAQWRAGHLPYTTIWDNKPVGIYAIFALFQAVFGDRVAAMRVASMACAGLAGFVVYRIAWGLTGARWAGLLAGAAYLLASLSNDGLAANTEGFMACCTALGVWAAGSARLGRWPFWRAAIAGLMLGAAFMVKYVSVLEAPAVLLLLQLRQPGLGWRGRVGLVAACGAGAALPLAAVLGLYWHGAALALWWHCSVAANLRRAGAAVSAGALRYALRTELLRWGPLFLAGLAVLAAAARRWRGPAGVPVFLAVWLVGGCLGVAAAKSFYDHYFLQILPALCVSLGWCASRLAARGVSGRLIGVGAVAVLVLPGWAGVAALREAAPFGRPDLPARIARDLAGPLAAAPGGLYVFDSEPILYALTGQTPPTRYVFPSVLTTSFLAHVAGVDAPREVGRILAGRPLFVIREIRPRVGRNRVDPRVYALMDATLAARYRLWAVYPGVDVYRRD